MSAYRVHESQVTSEVAIKAAIVDRIVQLKRDRMTQSDFEAKKDELIADARALVDDAVECYSEPVNLMGYQNDVREQKAHVICRRQFVNQHLGGGASNDVGFLRREDGSFEAIVSAYDEGRWWNRAAPRFWQMAMVEQAKDEALAAGFSLHVSEEGENIKLEAVMVGTGGQSSHGGAYRGGAGW